MLCTIFQKEFDYMNYKNDVEIDHFINKTQ